MIPYLFKSSSHDKIENYIATSSIGAPSLGVAGLPLFPENSELPILSIHVPQLSLLPPKQNPVLSRSQVILILNPGSFMCASILVPAFHSLNSIP